MSITHSTCHHQILEGCVHLMEGMEGVFDGRCCSLLSAQDTGSEEGSGRGRGRGKPGVTEHTSQCQPAISIHSQEALNEVPGLWGHTIPLRPNEGELAGLDPFHNLFSAQTLTIKWGVATEHRVLQVGGARGTCGRSYRVGSNVPG